MAATIYSLVDVGTFIFCPALQRNFDSFKIMTTCSIISIACICVKLALIYASIDEPIVAYVATMTLAVACTTQFNVFFTQNSELLPSRIQYTSLELGQAISSFMA